jgi:hypothetical protein
LELQPSAPLTIVLSCIPTHKKSKWTQKTGNSSSRCVALPLTIAPCFRMHAQTADMGQWS